MDLSSKFSLYDILAMIIPGGIIMAAIALTIDTEWLRNTIETCCGGKIVIERTPNFLYYVIILSFAYIIGLINNWISDGVFRGFRNNRTAIDNELLRVILENGNINLKSYVGSGYNNSKDSYRCLPCICITTLCKIIYHWLPCMWNNRITPNYVPYYKAYYALAISRNLGSIPAIESQVALLRNILIPLIVFFWCHWKKIFTLNELYPIMGIILTYIVMIQRQNKVYRLVWESANYYKI